ncbi:MAG: hypothetical protein A2Y95_10955 [Deltaproteobacteria bacterium RBG_13_65_10]|nr:MAG: hypothetical protein A2Y95_10955 [Deltaproteobacteria bacterium RBG_13_65_10]
MKRRSSEMQYVVCVSNAGYKASLVVRRIYKVVPDREASARGLLRVVDESGEDYLFPDKLFVAVELPKAVGKKFAMSNREHR